MIFLLIAAGLFAGGVVGGVPGSIVGGVLGYLFAGQLSVKEKLAALEEKLNSLIEPEHKREVVTPPVESLVAEAAEPAQPAQPEAVDSSTSDLAEEKPSFNPEVRAYFKAESEGDAVIREAPEVKKESPYINPVTAFLTGGNAAVRIGIVVLFFGIAFLLKYAIDHNRLPIELRLIAISIGAIVMLVVGWRLRGSRPGYALSLQGGAVGILYLVVFAALRLYHLLPPVLAFGLLVAIAGLSAILAILQDSLIFAVFGVVGGFLAPILTSSGSGNHVLLFSYYSILNLGILAVAWRKSWRVLNLIGFAFTFVIASLWGYLSYAPQHFASTEPFLIFFILLYVVIAVLFATRQKPELVGYVDGPVVFGTPAIGFALQSQLVNQYEYGLAWSALGFGLFYLTLASVLLKKRSENLKLLVRSFLAIGVLFGTFIIPLAFDGRWTSAAWAAEGSAAIWIGINQRHRLPRLFGILLIVGSSLAFISDSNAQVGTMPMLNSFFVGCLVICIGALFSSYQYYKSQKIIEKEEADSASWVLLGVGLAWWFVAGVSEINEFVTYEYKINSLFVYFVLSCLASILIARKLAWKPIGYTAFGLLPVMYAAAFAMFVSVEQPFANGGFVSWPIALVVFYRLLYTNEKNIPTNLAEYSHVTSFWLFIFLSTWFAYWAVGKVEALSRVWLEITLALVPAISIFLTSQLSIRTATWPIGVHRKIYLGLGTVPLLGLLWVGTLYVSISNTGDVRPLPYIPVLNPLDLTQMVVFVVALDWLLKTRPLGLKVLHHDNLPMLYGVAALTLFVWLNAILLRTLHHWVGIPFRYRDMFQSVLVQTSLSIFWGLLGFVIMIIANRIKKRVVWFAGGLLLGVVVVKLFLVDLAQSGTIERIISFIVVGVLLLVVGYFTPMPPRAHTGEVKA